MLQEVFGPFSPYFINLLNIVKNLLFKEMNAN